MPTSKKVRRKLYEILPPCDGPIVDLGSGWGHLLLLLAKKYPYAQIIGYETSFVPYLFSKCITPKNVTIYRKNFLKEDLSYAALVVCYLYPGAMQRLPKLPLISVTFAPKQKSDVIKVDDLYHTNIYISLSQKTISL